MKLALGIGLLGIFTWILIRKWQNAKVLFMCYFGLTRLLGKPDYDMGTIKYGGAVQNCNLNFLSSFDQGHAFKRSVVIAE